MLDEQNAAPKQINRAEVAARFLDGFFKHGDAPSLDAEDFQELIPESLRFRAFALGVLPFVDESNRVVTNFSLS